MKNLIIFDQKNLSKINLSDSSQNIYLEILTWYKNLTPYTRATYKDSVTSFCNLLNLNSVEEFKNIRQLHIIEYRDNLIELNMEKRTINTRISALSSLFNHLIEKQFISVNPTKGVKKMKVNSQKVESRALESYEVEAILKQPNIDKLIGLRNKAILSIMFNAGTRVGTIVRFKGKHIYEEGGYLILDIHIKGDKRNKVAVNSCIGANLKNYLKAIGYCKKSEDRHVSFNIPKEAPLFPQMSNNPKLQDLSKPISTNNLHKMWKAYAEKAKIERSNPHCARTTFITNALANGCTLQHVQATACHSDPRTTMSYNHSSLDYKNSASLRVSFG